MAHESLHREAEAAGYNLDERQLQLLDRYLQLVEHDRERFDLTAIRDRSELVKRHVGESLALLRAVEDAGLGRGARLTDVGSGGGVPGIPIAIARPDLDVVLVEASTRKAGWLMMAVADLGVPLEVAALRAEEAGRDPHHRERSDVVVAKAVAPLAALLELAVPLLKTGGLLFAPKGSRLENEITDASQALEQLATEVLEVRPLLPGAGRPNLLVARKKAPTEARFPRTSAAIRNRPLKLKRQKD